ncbi:hypothetical protein D3C75_1302780 [compost metagenome]
MPVSECRQKPAALPGCDRKYSAMALFVLPQIKLPVRKYPKIAALEVGSQQGKIALSFRIAVYN